MLVVGSGRQQSTVESGALTKAAHNALLDKVLQDVQVCKAAVRVCIVFFVIRVLSTAKHVGWPHGHSVFNAYNIDCA